MATRLYLPRTLSPISPSSWDSSWHQTSSVFVYSAVMHPTGATTGYVSRNKNVADNPGRIMVLAYITEPLAAGTISGTLTWAVAHRATNNLTNNFPRIVVRLMSNDLTVERAVLATDTSASEAGIAGEGVKTDLNPTLATTAITAGDRIVVEAGGQILNASADGTQFSFVFTGDPAYASKKGDPANAAGDFQFTADYTSATNRPWMEFSADLTFLPYAPEYLGRLATDTTLTLSWFQAYQGDDPAGYEVRIDGGTTIDAGNVLSYEFTGLTESTHHLLEVRAYNDAGQSAWVSVGGDTWPTVPVERPFDLIGPQVPADAEVWKTDQSLQSFGILTLSASAGAGTVTASPAGTGSLTLSGSGAARVAPTASANLDLTGTMTARARALATALLTLSGDGAPAGRSVATGTLTLSGTGQVQPVVVGSGSLTFSATGAGTSTEAASGTGLLVLTAVDLGNPAVGTASITLSGTGAIAATEPIVGFGFLVLEASGTALAVALPAPGVVGAVRRRRSAFVGG